MNATLEHVNITVSDPDRTAAMLSNVFGWTVRWSGESALDGRTVHVGSDDDYLAVYSSGQNGQAEGSYGTTGGLNHVGVLVDDLDATEQRVLAQGFETFNHGDYEPGRRFYFNDHDNIEFEVVSY